MTAIYIIISILFFGLLVIVHELGHFSMAKACGIRVDEFAVGMGPAFFQRTRGETLYSLRAIPFGGYCAMGEDDGETEDPRAFVNQKLWKKLLVLVAGSFNNFVMGYLIMLIIVVVVNFGAVPFGTMLAHSWKLCVELIQAVWESLGMLLSGEAGMQDLAGPVGIVDMMTEVANEAPSIGDAIANLAYLGSFIALNLAIMNMLPIPALDGGRVFLMLVTWVVEKISGKKLDPKYEGYINLAGMVLLLALMAYVMLHDIWRLIFHG